MVEENVVNHIANETHARTLWYKLETFYASKTRNNKLFLLKQAMNLRYKEGSFILDHLNECQGGEARVKVKGKIVEVKEGVNQGQSTRILNVTTVVKLDFFILYDDDVVNVASQETSWVIDSGSSIYAKSRKDIFTPYVASDFGTVKMGNDGLTKVIGIGDVCLEMDNDNSLLPRDVKHISDIRLNLISIGRLDDEGYYNTFSDGQWKLTRDKSSKLDMKTQQCIFTGYGLDEFGYRLYDPVEKKLVRSHDVVFMEDQTIQDVEKLEKVVP
ncbi:hypothetical protein Patl1_08345 [Pistacia atlantica]|uniref:Uncharacterized protein n=1 Tax=Pistacia atlantica TaxID=434234 RepID=A0ACC1AI06_9ROSI|nr:hypothetical protein Patl1_08345 [Pistacia atlantica]